MIVGGGPSGLATAIALARRRWPNIEVWERLKRPPNPSDAAVWGDPARSYNVGVSGRGQMALETLGCLDRVLGYCKRVNGRMDWTPGDAEGKVRLSDKKYATQVIQRDRLVAALLEEIEEKYSDSVSVAHETACASVEWLPRGGATLVREPSAIGPGAACEDDGSCEDEEPEVESAEGTEGRENSLSSSSSSSSSGKIRTTELSVPFVVGAEGASRRNAVMRAMADDPSCGTTLVRLPDTNPRVYKTIPIELPAPEFRDDLNYSARTRDGVALECLPTKEGMLVGILLVKPGDLETTSKLESLDTLRAYFDENFPMFAPYVSDEELAKTASRPLSTLPTFSYAGGRCLHRDAGPDSFASETDRANASIDEEEPGGAVLLGDAIHTVKPYFGLGVNSAFEDVCVLNEELDRCEKAPNGVWTAALAAFSKRRAEDAEALVRISRQFDGGFLTFVLPLILDGIFHKLAPKLFEPNTIQMMQREDWTFARVGRRKRADRIAQAAIVTVILGALASLIAFAARFVWGMVVKTIARGGVA